MRFHLKRPRADCPFRSDRGGYLREARARQIASDLEHGDKTFACHRTVTYTDTKPRLDPEKVQHCAGALVMMQKSGTLANNFLLRLAQMGKLLDPAGLDLTSPVVVDSAAFIENHRKAGL